MRLAIAMLLQQDLHQAVGFYQDIGMKLLIYSKGQWAEFECGGVKLALCPAEKEAVGGHSGLLFEIEDMEKFVANLKKKGIEHPEPMKIPLGMLITLTDPSGNKFDVLQQSEEVEEDGCCKEETEMQGCCSPSSCC